VKEHSRKQAFPVLAVALTIAAGGVAGPVTADDLGAVHLAAATFDASLPHEFGGGTATVMDVESLRREAPPSQNTRGAAEFVFLKHVA
jgi:hypothetical protein